VNGPEFPRVDLGRAADPSRFGVFDTLLAEDGIAWFVERHADRLRRACANFEIDAFERFDVAREVAQFVARLDGRRALVRTVAHGGSDPALTIRARAPRVAPAEGVELVAIDALPDPHGSWKTTERAARVLHGDQAERAGAFDALLVLADGEVVEAARANVFAVVDGVVTTPQLARGALPGIVRGLLLEGLRDGVERRLDLAALRRASEVWITSSGLRIAPVRSIRGVLENLPGPRGPRTIEARRVLQDLESAYEAGIRRG